MSMFWDLGFLAQLLSSGEYVEESGVRPRPWRAGNRLWEKRLTHPWFLLGGAWIHRFTARGLSLRLTEGGWHLVECALRPSLGQLVPRLPELPHQQIVEVRHRVGIGDDVGTGWVAFP